MRNYVRKGKTMLRKHFGYVKAKQFNRAESVVRAMKQYLRNVVDDAEHCTVVPGSVGQMVQLARLVELVKLSKMPIAQDRNTPGKDRIYSVREPQVECIAKGKVHKRYEFGVKPQHDYCDLGYRGHDYEDERDVQVVNRFRKRKPRAILRWWKRMCPAL